MTGKHEMEAFWRNLSNEQLTFLLKWNMCNEMVLSLTANPA